MTFLNADPEFDEKRKEANKSLLEILRAQIESRPTERFGQILRNCGFVLQEMHDDQISSVNVWRDEFNMEPTELVARVKATLKNR